MIKNFFSFPSSYKILSTEGLQGVEAFMEKDSCNDGPHMNFMFSQRLITVEFPDDKSMLEYFTLLQYNLGVEILEQ